MGSALLSAHLEPSGTRLVSLFVIAGLDPAIHPSSKNSCEDGWMPGSSPGMTSVLAFSPTSISNNQSQTQLRDLAAHPREFCQQHPAI
jgi:hypothetical protein